MSNKKSLLPICYIEAFERFAFLGFLSIFVFYLIDDFNFSKGDASLISASLGACIYALGVFGALLSDFCLGSKRSVILGLIMLCIGYFFIFFHSFITLIIGLIFLVLGSVLIKSNLATLLSKNYTNKNYAFGVFYIFVNIGCFLGQFVLGYVGQKINYNLAFFIAFLSLLLTIFIYLKNSKYFQNEILNLDYLKQNLKFIFIFLLGVIIISTQNLFVISKIISIFAIVLPFYFYIFIYNKIENKLNFKILGVYFLAAIVFYMLIFQSFNTLSILTRQKVVNEIFGFLIPSSWYVSFMFFISIFFSILLSKYVKNRNINEALLFACAMILASLAFILAGIFSNYENINAFYILIIYFLLGISQLIVGAIGLSVTSSLSPNKFKTSAIGVWFLCSAAGQGIEGLIVKLIDSISLDVYFITQGSFVMLCAILMVIFHKFLKV